MKLPSFGKKLIGMDVEWASILCKEGKRADLEVVLNLYWSDKSQSRRIEQTEIKPRQIEFTAKHMGFIAEPAPAKPGLKVGDFHKVCKNGHKKPYAGECQVCLYLWNEKQKDERAAAKGGQK